jgi:hypothetical protein
MWLITALEKDENTMNNCIRLPQSGQISGSLKNECITALAQVAVSKTILFFRFDWA